MKKFLIGSGWKMYKDHIQSVETAKKLKENLKDFNEFPVVIFPSATSLPFVHEALGNDTVIGIGGQNMHWDEEGAYTGEISINMLLAAGCKFVEINHQERRKYFNETNHTANLKLKTALRKNVVPFLCIGEEEKSDMNQTEIFLEEQIYEILEGISIDEVSGIVYAYEPQWAIGKNDSANFHYIQEIHHMIRKILAGICGKDKADEAYIIYGGGVRKNNYKQIAILPDVNGLFTTGCGLDADIYAEVIKNTAEILKYSEGELK